MITAKINITALDKTKLFPGKNGAQYLDVVMIETPNNQYGDDFMICQSVSKEDRLAGKRGAILGNAKFLKGANSPAPKTPAPADKDVPY